MTGLCIFSLVLSTKLNLLSGSMVIDFLDYLRRNQKILWDRHILSRTGNDAALGDRASEGCVTGHVTALPEHVMAGFLS